MAKSIRSKIKKRFRATKRATVGEVQAQKMLRKTLRRLETAINDEAKPAPTVDPETGRIIVPRASPGLAHLRAALGGSVAAAAPAPSAAGREHVSIRGAVPVASRKKLRYTFNTKLRAERLAAQLEDETDDEEDVRLGRVRKDEDEDMEDEEEVVDAAAIQESGVKKPADKPVRKRENGPKYKDNLRDGCPGLFDSDPVLMNPKRAQSHRKTKKRGIDSETLGAIGAEDAPAPDADDIIRKMLNSGKGRGAKAGFSFWKK